MIPDLYFVCVSLPMAEDRENSGKKDVGRFKTLFLRRLSDSLGTLTNVQHKKQKGGRKPQALLFFF